MSAASAAAADVELARELSIELERRVRLRRGGTREDARRRVAAHVGIAPGTMETLFRRRLKRVEGWVLRGLAQAMVADLSAEMRRHETLLDRAERCLVDLDPAEVATLRADLARTRSALSALGASPRPTPTAPAQTGFARQIP